jgi:hypothetical protein
MKTHKVAEVQGAKVLTNCGLSLPATAPNLSSFPTCSRCARRI